MPPRFRVNLYVVGGTDRASRAVGLLHDVADTHFDGDAEITVVDVTSEPALADAAGVITTPTYDLLAPLPRRRIIGMPRSADVLAHELLLIPLPPQAHRGPHTS